MVDEYNTAGIDRAITELATYRASLKTMMCVNGDLGLLNMLGFMRLVLDRGESVALAKRRGDIVDAAILNLVALDIAVAMEGSFIPPEDATVEAMKTAAINAGLDDRTAEQVARHIVNGEACV